MSGRVHSGSLRPGPPMRAVRAAMADIVESEGILSFINSYTTKALNADKKYTFRLTPTTAEISSYMVDAIKRQVPDAKSVVTLSPNDDSGKEVFGPGSSLGEIVAFIRTNVPALRTI